MLDKLGLGLHGYKFRIFQFLFFILSIMSILIAINIKNNFFSDLIPYIKKHLKIFITFHLVLFGWIFFRANSITDVYILLKNVAIIGSIKDIFVIDKESFIISIVMILILELFHLIQRHGSIRHMLSKKPLLLRWSIYYLLIMCIILFGQYGKNEFIYFQF